MKIYGQLDARLLLAAICGNTLLGVLAIIAVLYSPKSGDAATLTIVTGFVGITLTGLLTVFRGGEIAKKVESVEKTAERVEEKAVRIDKAVNGKLDRRLTTQDEAILSIQEAQQAILTRLAAMDQARGG